MLGENGTERNRGGRKSINPTHLVILIRLDKISFIFLWFVMPTKEEAIKDIFETEEEIRELELKAQLKPRFASAYYNMIVERKEFIKKLKEYYQL